MLSDCQHLNRFTVNRGRLHSTHLLASSLKLAARSPVSGCWSSCAIWQCKLHRATCSRFDTIPACDRQTGRRTDWRTDGRNCRS